MLMRAKHCNPWILFAEVCGCERFAPIKREGLENKTLKHGKLSMT